MKIVSDPFKPLGEVEKAFAKAKARLLVQENLQRPRFSGEAREQISSAPLHVARSFSPKGSGKPSAFSEEFMRQIFRSALSGAAN